MPDPKIPSGGLSAGPPPVAPPVRSSSPRGTEPRSAVLDGEASMTRLPRSAETRDYEAEARALQYVPRALLPTPEPEEGKYFYYVTHSAGGEPTNTYGMMRLDGWVPVTGKEQPAIAAAYGLGPDDVIRIGDAELCKTDLVLHLSRKNYYDKLADETIGAGNLRQELRSATGGSGGHAMYVEDEETGQMTRQQFGTGNRNFKTR